MTSISPSALRSVFLCLMLFSGLAQAGSWQNNVAIGGFNKVHIYTPDSVSAIGTGRALLVVLHGCTQSIDAFLGAELESAAETHGMVVAVPDAMNKAGFSCWSYWQGAVSRNSGDYQNLINMASALVADNTRNIDADQVYISGLSSGATFAAQTGCLAPDVFAGVAPSAGPTIGTSSGGAVGSCEVVSPSLFNSRCLGYAGSNAAHLDTQLAVVAHGDGDTTVHTCYNQQNADGYATVYGASGISGSNTVDEGGGHTAAEHLWTGNRVAMLWLHSLQHAWSGGAGASGSYVGSQSINFANYLGAFFTANNLRVDQNTGPQISGLGATAVNDDYFDIGGSATDLEGSVANVRITVTDTATTNQVQVIDTNVDGGGQFAVSSASFADGLYQITAYATDNEGKDGDPASVTERIGPEPPPEAPVLSNVGVEVSGQCATVTGTAMDANQNLASVDVAFATGTVAASLNGNDFSAQQCGLPGGSNSATVTATDSGGLNSNEVINFTIDAGSTGDYNFHIAEGHIDWGYGYAECYNAFGTADFTMREYDAGGGQCEWIADGAPSCKGPTQACTGGGGGPPDTTAPSVSLTAPADASTVSGQITVSATASDDTAVDRVEFSIDGGLIATDTTTPYSVSWDSSTVADGARQVSAQAFDAAGNQATDVHNVTVDNSGGGGGTQVNFDNDNATDGYVKATSTGGSPAVGGYEASYGLAVGRGSDGKSNRAILSFDTSSLPDTANVTQAWITVNYRSGSGDPWSGNNRMIIDIRNGCFGSCGIESGDWGAAADVEDVAEVPAFSSGAQDSSSLSAAGLAQINLTGSTQLRLRFEQHPGSTAYRFIDNGAGAVLHLIYEAGGPPDTTAPSVSLTAPADTSTVNGQVAITASASDDTAVNRVEFSVDGNLVAIDTTAPYSVSWDSSTVADGARQVSAQAFDAAGNQASDVHNVTVDNGGGGGGTSASFDNDDATDGYVKATSSGGSAAVGGYEAYYGLAVGRGSDSKVNKAVLSFDTSSLPDTATVTQAWITVNYRSGSGDPWSGGNRMVVDIRNGCFANCSIESGDWSATADADDVAEVPAFSSGAQDSTNISAAGLAQINLTGSTQFRLRFEQYPGSTAYRFIDNGDGAVLHLVYE